MYGMAMIILFSWLLFGLPNDNVCGNCHQDAQYLCAANTLPIKSRISIDISEVPTFFYKDFLAAKAEAFKKELDAMHPIDRIDFPKNSVLRFPTPEEWSVT